MLTPVFVKLIYRESLKFYIGSSGKLALLSITVLFFWMLVSVTYSPASGGDYFYEKLIFYFTNIILPVLLIIFTNKQSEWKYFKNFLMIVVFLAALIPLYNVYQEGLFSILNGSWFTRLSINDSNTIWFGRFLSFGFISVLIFTSNLKYKIIMMSVIITAIFFTGSKAVLYFTLVTFFIYYLLLLISHNNIRGKLYQFIVPVIFLIGALFFLFSSLNEQAFERRFSANSGTIDTRSVAIDKLINHNKNYLFGNGLASSGYALSNDYKRTYPHNVIIEVYYEFGIIGVLIYLIPYLLVAVKFFKRVIRRYFIQPDELFILSIIILSFFYSQTSGDIYTNQYGIIFSFLYLNKKNTYSKC
jgi:hypothetical protein